MMLLHHLHGRAAGLFVATLFLSTAALSAQTLPGQSDGPRDAVELGAFLDGQIEAILKQQQVAGGTVSVVKDGALFYSNGYGFADVVARRPVDPAATLFRIGSISKTFLWTAIMQLEVEGLVDLDADVNTYLTSPKIPEAFDQPITLRHLMTHTPGFEEWIIGLFMLDSTAVRPLSEILDEQMPARIWPPGLMASYSNHGTGIAGLVVETVSGLAWDDYVERRILLPLGMERTTFRQPLPAHLRPDVSRGYRIAGGRFEERPFEYVPLAPVGAASATAHDMARYMLMHLQGGLYSGVQVLDTTTAYRMQSRIFAPHNAVDGMAHGFYEMNRNGRRVIGHGGDTFWFHSDMALLPKEGVGIFLSFNTESAGGITRSVIDAFLDRYFPADSALVPAAVSSTKEDLKRFAGAYRSAGYPHKRLTKLLALMGTFNVAVTEDSLLEVQRGTPERYVPIGPMIFQTEFGQERLVFRESKDGSIGYLFFSDSPVSTFEKVGITGLPRFHLGVLLFGLFVMGSTLFVWPVAALIRRRHRVREGLQMRLPRIAVWSAWLASLLLVVFLIGTAVALSDRYTIVYGVPQSVQILLFLPLFAAALTLVTAVLAVIMVDRNIGTLWRRIWYVLITVGLLGLLWQLIYWRLLGFWY